MSKNQPTPQGQQVKTASLVFQLGVGEPDDAGVVQVTTEAHLLPLGPFRSTDTRPRDCAAWQLDAAIAARVIGRAAAQKNDFLIDYEHQSLNSQYNGQPAPAAGWFGALEWRDGSGLWAVGVDWTSDGKERIAEKEYRYISAVFTYYTETGEVLEIISVALTNTPGIDGLDPLTQRAAMTRSTFFNPPSTSKDHDMDKDQQIVALTSERDAAQTALTALKTEQDKAKHAELLTAALTGGRLAPAQKAWAEKQSLAALTEYLDATAPLVKQGRQASGDDGGHGLTDVEAAICTRMGVTLEAYIAARDGGAIKPTTKSA